MLGNKTMLFTEGARTLAVGCDAVGLQAVRPPLLPLALQGGRRCHAARRDPRAVSGESARGNPRHSTAAYRHLSLGAPSPCSASFATKLLPSVSVLGGVCLVEQWSGHPPLYSVPRREIGFLCTCWIER